jgi:hypothetical protein
MLPQAFFSCCRVYVGLYRVDLFLTGPNPNNTLDVGYDYQAVCGIAGMGRFLDDGSDAVASTVRAEDHQETHGAKIEAVFGRDIFPAWPATAALSFTRRKSDARKMLTIMQCAQDAVYRVGSDNGSNFFHGHSP